MSTKNNDIIKAISSYVATLNAFNSKLDDDMEFYWMYNKKLHKGLFNTPTVRNADSTLPFGGLLWSKVVQGFGSGLFRPMHEPTIETPKIGQFWDQLS